MTYGYPTWNAYNRRVQVLKSAREMAANEWARFRNEVDSEVKLEVLRAYINAVLAERGWRANDWDPEWGTQDHNHRRWIERLDEIRRDLESQEAILQHRIDTERYETVPCGSNSTGGRGRGAGELRDCPTGNICGNPCCGQTFICAADYNRIVIPQGYRGV